MEKAGLSSKSKFISSSAPKIFSLTVYIFLNRLHFLDKEWLDDVAKNTVVRLLLIISNNHWNYSVKIICYLFLNYTTITLIHIHDTFKITQVTMTNNPFVWRLRLKFVSHLLVGDTAIVWARRKYNFNLTS